MVIPLIETVSAGRDLDAILDVPGVDAVYFGPADYSASAGFLGQWEGPGVAEHAPGLQGRRPVPAGMACGIMATGLDDSLRRRDQGFQMIGLGADTGPADPVASRGDRGGETTMSMTSTSGASARMSTLRRAESLGRIRAGKSWDLLVIGGGATGLGTAVDAASRGYRTLLLEAHDFAEGTSSRSTKLIHGGVRYLAQGNVPLVREALHERGLLLRNAPHLVHRARFRGPGLSLWQLPYYATGLWLYDRLAGRSGPGPLALDLAGRRRSRCAPTLRPPAARGDRLHRRPVRRRAAGDLPGPHRWPTSAASP